MKLLLLTLPLALALPMLSAPISYSTQADFGAVTGGACNTIAGRSAIATGCAITGASPTVLSFQPTSGTADLNTAFPLGVLTIVNGTIRSGTGGRSVELPITLTFNVAGSASVVADVATLFLTHTPNSGGAAASADTVSLGGVPVGGFGPYLRTIRIPEDDVAAGIIYAQLTSNTGTNNGPGPYTIQIIGFRPTDPDPNFPGPPDPNNPNPNNPDPNNPNPNNPDPNNPNPNNPDPNNPNPNNPDPNNPVPNGPGQPDALNTPEPSTWLLVAGSVMAGSLFRRTRKP